MEIWKDIKDYEGYYQISSEGRVKNINTNKILIGDLIPLDIKEFVCILL